MHRNPRFTSPRLTAAVAVLFVALGGTTGAASVTSKAGQDTRLARTAEAITLLERGHSAGSHSAIVSAAGARLSGIHVAGRARTSAGHSRVIVQTSDPAAVRTAVQAAGGRVERSWDDLVQVTVPSTAVPALASLDGVDFVRPPLRLVEYAVDGEEVGTSLAGAWQQKGLTGKGVKVAVIDGGFAGLADRQAAGDLPGDAVTADFCGGHFADGSEHGTAVAEIVHEMAPDAQLVLVCINTEVDLVSAENYVKSQGVHVINFSAGFDNAGRGDGTGVPSTVVADARAAGILWVNAAGNEAQTHWAGTFTDTNGDSIHEFAAGDIGNSFVFPNGSIVCGSLKWDEWPAGVSDFDLFLILSPNGQIIGGSVGDQSGALPPTEDACFENQSGSDAIVAWVIFGYRVTTQPRFDLFTHSPALQYQTAAGSVTDPATSPAALAVGALCWQSRALEVYSSQGPTIDGRTKPDLVGHDSVSGSTYGASSGCGEGFAGTSASSPEVAGAAALVKQAFPASGPDQLRAFLVGSARDLAAPGADSATGAGELQLPAPPDRVVPTAAARASSGRAGQIVRLMSRASDDSGRVQVLEEVTRNGKVIATLRSAFVATQGAKSFATGWRAPAGAGGRFEHCVRARDKAGNTSEPSCAAISVR